MRQTTVAPFNTIGYPRLKLGKTGRVRLRGRDARDPRNPSAIYPSLPTKPPDKRSAIRSSRASAPAPSLSPETP